MTCSGSAQKITRFWMACMIRCSATPITDSRISTAKTAAMSSEKLNCKMRLPRPFWACVDPKWAERDPLLAATIFPYHALAGSGFAAIA